MTKGPYDHIGYIPVPRMCSGNIVNIIDNRIYEVVIYKSPKGKFNGPIQCDAIYQPGMSGNYKIGDMVKVMVYFLFGGEDNKYHELATGHSPYIMGLFKENSFITQKLDIPNTKTGDEVRGFVNEKSGAGFTMNDYGHTVMSSGGVPFNFLKSFGSGTNKDLSYSVAQNFKRVISNNSPLYLTMEHFGMYSGKDLADETTKLSPEDIYISKRTFVQATSGFDDWVSTCEGTFAPLVGANNHYEEIVKSKETIYSKIINKGSSRVTIEVGEAESDFLQIRVDDVKKSEIQTPIPPGAIPAILGNRFKFSVDNNGSFELLSNGSGVPVSDNYGLIIKSNSDGLKIYCNNKISISHSDSDINNNSIVLDPKKGIDIIAENGLRVNGQEVVLKSFIDWLYENKNTLGQVITIGGPVPMHPVALASFILKMNLFSKNSGFVSKNKGFPALGVITKKDGYRSV
jgi:hypothetical protein